MSTPEDQRQPTQDLIPSQGQETPPGAPVQTPQEADGWDYATGEEAENKGWSKADCEVKVEGAWMVVNTQVEPFSFKHDYRRRKQTTNLSVREELPGNKAKERGWMCEDCEVYGGEWAPSGNAGRDFSHHMTYRLKLSALAKYAGDENTNQNGGEKCFTCGGTGRLEMENDTVDCPQCRPSKAFNAQASNPSALGDTPRTEEELFARMEKGRSEFYNTRLFSHPAFANKVKELWPKAFDGQTPKEWVEASLSVCKWVNALFAERNRELTAAQSRVKELEEQIKHWKHLNEAEKKKFDRENVSLQSELEKMKGETASIEETAKAIAENFTTTEGRNHKLKLHDKDALQRIAAFYIERLLTTTQAQLATLEKWKREMLEVTGKLDSQKIAKLLGCPWGESTSEWINKRVPEVLTELAQLRANGGWKEITADPASLPTADDADENGEVLWKLKMGLTETSVWYSKSNGAVAWIPIPPLPSPKASVAEDEFEKWVADIVEKMGGPPPCGLTHFKKTMRPTYAAIQHKEETKS